MWYVWAMKWNGQKVTMEVVNGTREDAMKALGGVQKRLAYNRAFCQVGATKA